MIPHNGNEKALIDSRGSQEGSAMSFEEIAAELGTTRQGAWIIYQRALRKLRRSNPEFMAMLHDMGKELDSHRYGSHEKASNRRIYG